MAQSQSMSPAPARPRKRKKRSTARDMFLSLAVILIPILLLSWLYTNNLPDYPVQAVDPAPALAQARSEAPYPVYVPANLPAGEGGWTVTQASWVAQGTMSRTGDGPSGTNEWLWGALDPTQTYYAVNQSDGPSRLLVERVSRKGNQDGTSTVNGQQWQRWISPDGRTRVLAREEGDMTITVSADATYEGIEALASTLTSR
ncbi:DUF4245 domain-containing protein [Raineyella antarctica]|nr:DUF4245 domain-containing protein [Raineyella antarctica]